MDQSTGGHYRDTGDGPTRLDPPTGRGAESLPHLAYSAYLAHVRGCAECQRQLHNCLDGRALWATYKGAAAAIEERQCARCERMVTTWILQPNGSDHGPLEAVWCEDAADCQRHRDAVSLRLPRRFVRH